MTTITTQELAKPALRPFVFSRTFAATRDQIWRAWTERERLMQWFGPKGFTMPTATLDFRPGGSFHYCLETPDGVTMWGKFSYREIEPQKRIVLVNAFSDEAGGVTRHPFSDTWPLQIHSTFTITEEYGRTTGAIEWIPIAPTPEERDTFESAHDGMRQGWIGTFDQLEEYLSIQNSK